MAASCAAPAIPATAVRVAESPLDQAGHVGSAVLKDNEAWLAALDGKRTPGEKRYLADCEAARAEAQRDADRAANAAFRPGQYLPVPARTTGPMSGALDDRTETAMRRYDELHDRQPAARKRGRFLRRVRSATTRDLT